MQLDQSRVWRRRCRRFVRLHKLATQGRIRSKSRGPKSQQASSDNAPDTAPWSACHSCRFSGAIQPKPSSPRKVQVQAVEHETFSWPSTQSCKDAPQPFCLLGDWLLPHRPAGHIIDELSLLTAVQMRAALLAEARHLVPRPAAVDVTESIRVMRHLRLGRSHAIGAAGLIASVVKLFHLGFGELAAISLLDEPGKRVNISAGGLQRANCCTRSSDDFSVPIARQQANKAC